MFNQATLAQLEADVGAEVLAQLMQVFCKESTHLVSELLSCESLNEETVRLSHSLKSCSRSYGADTLADLAEQLEMSAKEGSEAFFEQRKTLNQTVQATLSALP